MSSPALQTFLKHPITIAALMVAANVFVIKSETRDIKTDVRDVKNDIMEIKTDMMGVKEDINKLEDRQSELEGHGMAAALHLLRIAAVRGVRGYNCQEMFGRISEYPVSPIYSFAHATAGLKFEKIVHKQGF